MGNYWKGISSDALVQSELDLLKRAGLKHEDFKFIDVKLDNDADPQTQPQVTENYIHCVEIRNQSVPQDKELPIMVLVHGYGAGGAVFFRILKDLSMYFHLYVVDLLGMGCSGRPQYTAFSVDLAEDFFLNSLKLWKEKIGLREKFILTGHSLGGYISAVYAMRHPEDLKQLLLLSPVGIPEKPDTFTHEEVAQRFGSLKGRIGARIILKLWEKNYTPFELLRFSGNMGSKAFLKFYMKNRMYSITAQEEFEEMKAYLHQIFLRPGSGEYALNTILQPGSWAKNPLVHRIPSIEVPIGFFYGEVDWMDPSAVHYLLEHKLVNGRIYGVEGADHHMYLDNPIDTVYKMLIEVFGMNEANQYLEQKKQQIIKDGDLNVNKKEEEEKKEKERGEFTEQIIT